MSSNLLQNQAVLSEMIETQMKENVTGQENVKLLPVFIRHSSGDVKLCATSDQGMVSGFRKIEPKPAVVAEISSGSPNPDSKGKRKRRKDKERIRFLGSNATRRGVRTCLTCKGRIGYRSKICKHCLKPPAADNFGPSSEETTHKDVFRDETNKTVEKKKNRKENVLERPLLADHDYVQITSCSIPNSVTLPLSLGLCSTEALIASDDDFRDDLQTVENENEERIQEESTLGCDSGTRITAVIDYREELNPRDDKEKDQNTQSGLIPENKSEGKLTEDVTVGKTNANNISGKNFEDLEGKTKCTLSNGRKRRQEAHPSKMRNKRKFCSGIQFMRIEPKPRIEVEQQHGSDSKNTGQGEPACTATQSKAKPVGNRLIGKTECIRFLDSNPTRRGIMLCPLCQKEVGCRSKTCKHCKVTINFNLQANALDHINLLVVQLSAQTSPDCVVFSVKKLATPSEERCCIKQATAKEDDPARVGRDGHGSRWCCECVGSTRFSDAVLCAHVTCLLRSPKVVQARTATLTAQTIDSLPIDNFFKNKLKQLWEKNEKRELPLVQQVALNTLVVLDIEKEAIQGCSTDDVGCVHIRFEKIKRNSVVQHHIFCSGKSCSVWTPIENQKDSPVTCLHYCISLWAIASDEELQAYFRIFLDAPQVYLHSEVFESILSF